MIKAIEPPDSHYLRAAQGWAELGNYDEADAELRLVAPDLRTHPQVLASRLDLYSRSKRWDLAAEVGGMLVAELPGNAGPWISLAYAVRRKTDGGIPQAREILTRAHQLFPSEALIVYNLACYDCQLGQTESAMEWIKQAIRMENKREIKRMARADADLQPLWPQIELL